MFLLMPIRFVPNIIAVGHITTEGWRFRICGCMVLKTVGEYYGNIRIYKITDIIVVEYPTNQRYCIDRVLPSFIIDNF